MIKNVTRCEVVKAAKESILAAVECSMRHQLFNANIQNIRDADISAESCALCERGRNIHQALPTKDFDSYSKCSNCLLKDVGQTCCQEYSEARSCMWRNDLNGFKAAAVRLYIRLVTIREKLLAEQLKTIPPKPLRIPIKIGNKYVDKLTGKKYLLASTGASEVSLINIDTGLRWRCGIVGNPNDISDLEFCWISGQTPNGPKDFELVHGRIVFDS